MNFPQARNILWVSRAIREYLSTAGASERDVQVRECYFDDRQCNSSTGKGSVNRRYFEPILWYEDNANFFSSLEKVCKEDGWIMRKWRRRFLK